MSESVKVAGESNLSFGSAVRLLEQGVPIQREGWNGKGLFIFKQVEAVIDGEIVPKMQSLPQKVKDIFISRDVDNIKYKNQLTMVYPNNTIYGWVASPSDILSHDWQVYKP